MVTIDSNNSIVVIVPATLKRLPSRDLWNPSRDVGEEQKFDPMHELWQEYVTTDGFKVLVKPIVTKVIKYAKINRFGEPIYSVNVQSIINLEKFSSPIQPFDSETE